MRMPTVAVISPPERVRRVPPVNTRAGDEVLFQHELVRDIEATESLEAKNVGLLPNGFLFSGMRLLPESFTSIPRGSLALKRWIKMVALGATARKRKDVERGLFATDEFSNGYFHWVCDVLPRLEAACSQENRGRTFLVPAMAAFPYLLPSLEPYHFAGICVSSWEERVQCADLVVVTQAAPTGNYRPSLMKALRDRFRVHFGEGTASRKLYVSRARAKRRRILNEDQTAEIMSRHGF